MKQRIENILNSQINPEFLEVINNSHLHANHFEGDAKESHFKVVIGAENLRKISKIAAHRKINSLLKDEFKNGLHALEVKIL